MQSQGPGSRGSGPGGRAPPNPPHTHCQRSFSLLTAGPCGAWPPLCVMDRAGL